MNPSLESWHRLHQKYLYCDRVPYDFRTSSLAAHLGVSRRTIELWVNGRGEPSEIQASMIENYLERQSKN